MGWGMMGGVGQFLSKESDRIGRIEEADLAAERQKNYQGWLMAQQEQYGIRSEQRAEDRTIRTEQRTDVREEQRADRKFERDQREAPTRRQIKVDDEKASARGKSEVAAETVDTDVVTKQKLTDAGVSTPDKRVKESQADYYDANADYTRAGRAAAEKLDPKLKAQYDSLDTEAKTISTEITKAKAQPGGWDPANNPGQAELDKQLRTLRARQRALLESSGGATNPDPLGKRGGSGAPPARTPSGARPPAVDDSDRPGILRSEYRKAQDALATAKTPEERSRAQSDIDALQREAKAGGFSLDGAAPAGGMVKTGAPTPTPKPSMQAPTPTPKPAVASKPAPTAPPGDLRNLFGGTQPGAGGQPQTLMDALGANTADTGLNQIVGQRAPAIEAASREIAAAQQAVVQAGQGQDQQGVAAAMRRATVARLKLDTLLQDMEPGMAQRVREAAFRSTGVQ